MKILLFLCIFSQVYLFSGNDLVNQLKQKVSEISEAMPANYQSLICNITGSASADAASFPASEFYNQIARYNFNADVTNRFANIVWSQQIGFQIFNTSFKNVMFQHEEFIGIARNVNGQVQMAFVKANSQGESSKAKIEPLIQQECSKVTSQPLYQTCMYQYSQFLKTSADCQKNPNIYQYQSCIAAVKDKEYKASDCQNLLREQYWSCMDKVNQYQRFASIKARVIITEPEFYTIDHTLRSFSLKQAIDKLNQLPASNSIFDQIDEEFSQKIDNCDYCLPEIKKHCIFLDCQSTEKSIQTQLACQIKQNQCKQYLEANHEIEINCKQCVCNFQKKFNSIECQ